DHDYFQNSWEFGNQQFSLSAPITPFLRSESVLRKAIEGAGYTWNDRFHSSDELRKLVLVSNRTMWIDDTLNLNAPLSAFLPDQNVSDLLKEYCRLFCLAPFSNVTGNVISLQPLAAIVNNEPRYDWTNYAGREHEKNNFNGGVSKYEYPEAALSNSYRESEYLNLGQPDVILPDFIDTQDYQVGLTYFLLSRNLYIRAYDIEGTRLFGFAQGFGAIENDFGQEIVSPNLTPLQTSQILFYPNISDNLLMGHWSNALAPPLTAGVGSPGGNAVGLQLSLYRGYANTTNGASYPFGSMNNYSVNFQELTDQDHVLHWLGDKGLYNKFWRDWDAMLQRSGAVTRTFLLPLAQLLDFDFQFKVRVGGQNYFVRSLEFNVTLSGISPAKCELLSVS
ncbi:MAG: hypothetical protein AAFO91_13035, partial [Bacteroidota bacterium]